MNLTMVKALQSDVIDLTARQMEILGLVSKGCSNIDISELLEISPNTVKAHIATVLERLHVSNRTEASVLYEKHLHERGNPANNQFDISPFIDISLLYRGLSRTEEIAENISQLLHGFEIMSIHSQASEHLIKDSKLVEEEYLIKVDDLTDVNADLQISLIHNDQAENQQTLLYKTNHSLAVFDSQSLVKYAVDIYQHVLKFEASAVLESNSKKGQLCEILWLCEAVNIEQLTRAYKLSNELLDSNSDCHLLYAVNSYVKNKLITNGYSEDVKADLRELTVNARKALSMKPTSSWSQLAFAYFCALSSDLKLARKHLLASIEANPCQHRALQLLGQIDAFEGRIQESIGIFNQLLVTFPSNESKGVCYGALALVHYCAEDYTNCKSTAVRALMYEDAPQVPMILTLISVAELEQDNSRVTEYKERLGSNNITAEMIEKSLLVAQKIIPPERLNNYMDSLHRSGVI